MNISSPGDETPTPTISVVVPTYNYGHFVGEAVDSALSQTLTPCQVIVVDDGSTDDTRSRLAAYGDKIVYIYQSNRGLSAARNAGIEAATGKYVALLDSDDAFHPRKLEYQVAFLEANPEVGLVGTACLSDPLAKWPQVQVPPVPRLFSLEDVILRVRFCPSSAVLRRSLWPIIGPFDPAVSAASDRDFWIRAAAVTKLALIDAPLTFYRIHAQNMTRNVGLMVAHERAVISKTFSRQDLRNRWVFRRHVEGLAAASASYMYFRDNGKPRAAAGEMARSLLCWPMPLHRADVPAPLFRPRLAFRILETLLKGLSEPRSKFSRRP